MKSHTTPNTFAARRLSTVAYAALFIAVVYALALNLSSFSPIRNVASDNWSLLQHQKMFAEADEVFRSAADGHNLEVHIANDPLNQSATAGSSTILFFRAPYAIYPKRVFVGEFPPPINFPEQLRMANILPGDAWLRAHDVKNIVTISPSPSGNVSMNLRPVK